MYIPYEFTVAATDQCGRTDRTRTYTLIVEQELDRNIIKQEKYGPSAGGVALIYDRTPFHSGQYDFDVDPLAQLFPKIKSIEQGLGFTVTEYTSYSQFMAAPYATIDSYAHIWDVGYDTLFRRSAPAAPGVFERYLQFIKDGGSMFVLGENASFNDRNSDIAQLIYELGGGSVGLSFGLGTVSATIPNEFLVANASNNVTFLAPGTISNPGTGTALAVGGNGEIFASLWRTNTLGAAPLGALCAIYDVNYFGFQDGSTLAQEATNFIENTSIVLNKF